MTHLRRLRILMVCGGNDWGGLQVYAVRQSAALAARGHGISFACRPGTPLAQAVREQQIRALPLAPVNSMDLASAYSLAAALKWGDFDLLHAHFGRDYAPALLAGRLARKPVILTRHVLFPASEATRKRMVNASRIIAVSHAVRRVLVEEMQMPPSLVTTVWTGVDAEQFSPLQGNRRVLPALGLPPEAPVFGMVTRLLPGKRCDTFLNAAAIVKRSYPRARYLLVGDGPHRESLEQQVQDLGLQSEVIFTGFRQDVDAILPELTAMVSASEGEALSCAILEAMACGVPVLASRVGGNPELVLQGETGFLFEIGDHHDLADEMKLLAGSPARARAMGEQARQRTEQYFDREMMLDNLERVYQEAL